MAKINLSDYMNSTIFSYKYRISDLKKGMIVKIRREYDRIKLVDLFLKTN